MSEPWLLKRALWRDLPLLNFSAYACLIAYAEIAYLDPPRLDYVPTFLFPLVVPAAVYALRFKTATRPERLLGLAVVFVPLLLVVTSLWLAPATPKTSDELRHLYEFSAFLNVALVLVHAGSEDRARVAWLLGPIALYGLLLENGGILLGFFSELHYLVYLGPLPAPVATMGGWVMVFYLVIWVTWQVQAHLPWVARSAALSAAVATIAGLLLDLQIDPIASAVGFWRWNALLPGAVFGVPLANFVAWTCAIFPFAYAVFHRQAASGLAAGEVARPPHRRWLLWRVPAVLGGAAVLFLLLTLVVELGFAGPTFTILRMAAGR